MKAEDLKLNEIIDFKEGHLSLHGRRLVIHPIHAFAQLRRDLVDKLGMEHARRIFTRFGFYWGNADAAAMTRIFEWDNITEWLKAGPRMHALQGDTKVITKSLHIDEEKGTFNMEVDWPNSGEAEEHRAEFGKTDHCVCWILVGYASGYATLCLKRNVYFVEQKCIAKGDRICSAIGKDAESWGEEITPYLPYFQEIENIQSKIQELTVQLKRKDRELATQRKRLKALEHKETGSFVEVRSPSFRRALELANRVARFGSSVLITGESGVGKEILARHIHKLSPRNSKDFLAVNCAALPETLLESELFGHKAGSFTGAIKDRLGLFEQANKGTVFLDEIGDVSPAMQMKLLRVLQEQEITRVGENKPRKIDVRVMAATNRNLSEEIQKGTFREDLYYRLAVVEVAVPPLRDRKDDILPLTRFFVKQFAKKLDLPQLRLDAGCLDYLLNYAWPGNVRELENAIERAAVLCKDDLILPEYLPPAVTQTMPLSATTQSTNRTLAQVENDYINSVLATTSHNQTRTAAILGISTTTLWRKLKNQK